MEEVKKQENTTQSTASASAPIKDGAVVASSARPAGRGGFNDRRGGAGAGRGGSGAGRRPGGPSNKPFVKKDEFQEQTLDMRRVTRVMAGGKRFRFRATIVIGDLRGRVGVGMGKGVDLQQALGKAQRDARKHIITVPLVKRSIPHEVEAKYSAAQIRLKPAQDGHGLVAGGAARAVLSLAGIKDITAKTLGRTPNQVTNALATFEALKMLKTRKQKANKQEAIHEKQEVVKS